ELAAALQHCPAACLDRLPGSGPGGVRASARRMAGCAIPTSSAGHAPAGAKANPKLTFKPDHQAGADQASDGGRFSSIINTSVSSATRNEPSTAVKAPIKTAAFVTS